MNGSIGLVVGISGCSGSGKSSLAECVWRRGVFAILSWLTDGVGCRSLCYALSPRTCVVSLDAFYKTGTDAAPEDFESAELFDFDLAAREVEQQRSTHRYVFVEGIVLLASDKVASLLDMVVDLNVADVAVARERRLRRDVGDSSPWNSAHYFDTHVWPAHLRYRAEHAHKGLDKPRLVLDVSAATQREVLEQAKRFILDSQQVK
jgi:uridine kinase